MRALLLLFALAACGSGAQRHGGDDIVDACGGNYCDPLAQTGCRIGEKCTWVNDTSGTCSRLNRCVPDGGAAIGEPCAFGPPGPTGYDNCVAGSLCSSHGGSAVCRAICNEFGETRPCDASHACFYDPAITAPGDPGTVPAVCLDACDPLADNDFDGSGSALTRAGSACGSAIIGCYGFVGTGTLAPTHFGCMREKHYDLALRHRAECTVATGCVDSNNVVDDLACSQGYMPLLTEATGVSTTVCIALCKPLDCYAGNCGSNNDNRLGAAPHRCTPPDAGGNFGSGEECAYFWYMERDADGTIKRSPFSDTLGFCFDHSKYGLPACEDLPLHGSGSGEDAVSLGCVSSQTAGLQ